jgi:hypothetical protein
VKPYLHPAGHGIVNFQWNIDCSVGKNADNTLITDVSYIQWYYKLAAQNPKTPPDRRAIYQNVEVTGHCSGTGDDPLSAAIWAHQEALQHPEIDGKISVAHGSTGKIGSSAFFVLRLGARLADMFPNVWPRLDLMPGCPASVAQASRQAVPQLHTS